MITFTYFHIPIIFNFHSLRCTQTSITCTNIHFLLFFNFFISTHRDIVAIFSTSMSFAFCMLVPITTRKYISTIKTLVYTTFIIENFSVLHIELGLKFFCSKRSHFEIPMKSYTKKDFFTISTLWYT